MNAGNDPLSRIVWPDDPSVETLAQAVGDLSGFDVILRPIPPEHRQIEWSGLTVGVGTTAYVYYDEALSPLVRDQTILHEYAHLLHGDVVPDKDPVHYRSSFDDPREHRAELTGTRLWQALQRQREDKGGSEVSGFISGRRRGRK